LTAPRWIHDLAHGTLVESTGLKRIQLDVFKRSRQDNHRHELILTGNQSAGLELDEIISCVCNLCDYHFVIKTHINPKHANERCDLRQVVWPYQIDSFPLHHLVFVDSRSADESGVSYSKHYPIVSVERFVCSAGPCTFELTLEISDPRVPLSWVDLLKPDRIRKNIRQAREEDPERYQDARDEWANAGLQVLNTYMKDVLEGTTKNISKRNKRFHVTFGPDCDSIFETLEYETKIVPNNAGDEVYWVPPSVEKVVGQPTPIGSRLAYYEDVRTEIQSLIVRSGVAVAQQPALAGSHIEKALHCANYPKIHFNKEDPYNPAEAAVPAEYRILGALPNYSKELMLYAYHRQCDVWPGQAKILADSLRQVASKTTDLYFQEAAMLQVSLVESAAEPGAHGNQGDDDMLWQAYQTLEMVYPNKESDDDVIRAYRDLAARKPDMADTARAMLEVIGKHRGSQKIKDAARPRMNTWDALQLLRVNEEWGPANILAAAYDKVRLPSRRCLHATRLWRCH
jgi:ubiquitin carboxyl-terminal hydrolase 25